MFMHNRSSLALAHTAMLRYVSELGESRVGFAIHKDKDGPVYLEYKEYLFSKMKAAGVKPTEHAHHNRFWADANFGLMQRGRLNN